MKFVNQIGALVIASQFGMPYAGATQEAQPAAAGADTRVTLASQLPGTTHLLPATVETVQWGWFDNAEAPRLTIDSGDTVIMETMMHSHNQIVPGATIEFIKSLRTNFPGRGPHSITGPIYVNGAESGDVLKVKINRIVPRAYGTNFNIPGMFGQFAAHFPNGKVRFLYLDTARNTIEFLPGIELPLRPFPGIIGTARAQSGKYSTVPPGEFGGNMDIRDLIEGATVYLPVFVKGALLWSGDSHATQGNGEVNLTAVETAFKEFNITITVLKGEPLELPRIESPTHWITMGFDKDLNLAYDIARKQTIKFLMQSRAVDEAAAATIMQRVSDCRVSQVVNIKKGVHCMNPLNRGTQAVVIERPEVETGQHYVALGVDADLNKAMDAASMAMINFLDEKLGLERLDAYALASVAMDCRVGQVSASEKRIHCLIPKKLWVRH